MLSITYGLVWDSVVNEWKGNAVDVGTEPVSFLSGILTRLQSEACTVQSSTRWHDSIQISTVMFMGLDIVTTFEHFH